MDPDICSRAAANVTWLAAQSTGTWNPSPSRREVVEAICDTSRWIHTTTAKALHDVEPDLPDPYWLQAAENSLVWCNTIVRGGLRARVAWVTIGQLGGDQAKYAAAWETVDSHALALRGAIGKTHAMLEPHELELVEANLALAQWAARKWAGNVPQGDVGYSMDDAYQDAVIGLSRAAKSFDPDKGFRFSTHAYAYLYQSITVGEAKARNRKAGKRGKGDFTCTTDDAMDAAEWASASPAIAAATAKVCRDDVDRRIVAAIMGAPDGTTRSAALRPLAAELDTTLGALTHRWYTLRDMLAEELEHLRAS